VRSAQSKRGNAKDGIESPERNILGAGVFVCRHGERFRSSREIEQSSSTSVGQQS